MKLLIFSDIHNNLKALERLMDMEADYYFAAGDLSRSPPWPSAAS